jgi:hypothetical protein
MSRLAWVTAAAAIVASVLVGAPAAGSGFPARIDFPPDWRAEGIYGHGHTFWAGNTATGSIFKGDVRTGTGSVLVNVTGRSAFGVFVDKWNRLWVAGGGTHHAYVYDADTGAQIADITLPDVTGSGIINDVVATRDAVYFTNTNSAANPGANVLFKVPLGKHGEIGTPVVVPVTFPSANGIEATKNGKTLVVASFSPFVAPNPPVPSKIYTVDTATNAVHEITITENGAPASLPRADGLILKGHTLYLVLNLPNANFPGRTGEVAVVHLNHDLTAGEVVGHLQPDQNAPLVNPATADIFGNHIYVITRNTPFASPTFNYLARIDVRGGHDDEGDHDDHGHKAKQSQKAKHSHAKHGHAARAHDRHDD